jgi:hypothetical protein
MNLLSKRIVNLSGVLCGAMIILLAANVRGYCQENYEIQVYGSETQAPSTTMVELHSNFTINGANEPENGTVPTDHAEHETVEITQGITPWFEVGGYLFTNIHSGYGWQWVGDHIRPRVRAPEDWQWPVGASLSIEFGYQRAQYSADTWTLEVRPIIDKQMGGWYISLNPSGGFTFKGPDRPNGFDFSPDFKIAYAVTPVIDLGIEDYADYGPLDHFNEIDQQQHQIFPTIDLNIAPEWEINAGVGVGLTPTTDHLIAKLILGRRFGGN